MNPPDSLWCTAVNVGRTAVCGGDECFYYAGPSSSCAMTARLNGLFECVPKK